MAKPGPNTIVCDVALVSPEAATVDALARLQLGAKRLGRQLRLRNSSRELQQLIDFMGLRGVLCVEPGGEAEERKQRLRVEEERELADPAA